MAIVVFDLAGFRARYPEFNAVADAMIDAYFVEATIYLNNTDASPVVDIAMRALLLNMLIAHIAQLAKMAAGAGLVGRLSQASEGSVSASAEMGPITDSNAWYMQTQYGANYWNATAAFRTFRYAPGRSYANRGRWSR